MPENHVTDETRPIPRWLQIQAPRFHNATSRLSTPSAMSTTQRSLSVGARPLSAFYHPRAENTIGSTPASESHEDAEEHTIQNRTSVTKMPPEITAEIIRYLDTPDVFALRAASNYFRDHVDARPEHYLREYVCSLDTQHLKKLLKIAQDSREARVIKRLIFSAGGAIDCHTNPQYFNLIQNILETLASAGAGLVLGVRRSYTEHNFKSSDRKAAAILVRFFKRLLRNKETVDKLNLQGFIFDLGWKRRNMQTAPDCGCYEPLTEWAWTLATSSNLPVTIRVYDWDEPEIVSRIHGQITYDPVKCGLDIQTLGFRHWRVMMPFIRKLNDLRALSISSTEIGFEPFMHLLMNQPPQRLRLSHVIVAEQALTTTFPADAYPTNWKVRLVNLADEHKDQLKLCKLSNSI